jgi:transposase InsO family protein
MRRDGSDHQGAAEWRPWLTTVLAVVSIVVVGWVLS